MFNGIVKDKLVEYSRSTANANPQMIYNEYDRLINKTKERIENAAIEFWREYPFYSLDNFHQYEHVIKAQDVNISAATIKAYFEDNPDAEYYTAKTEIILDLHTFSDEVTKFVATKTEKVIQFANELKELREKLKRLENEQRDFYRKYMYR